MLFAHSNSLLFFFSTKSGYMAPEYAMEGIFSVKSDVYSFGVLLLEMISGRKNNGFYLSGQGHSLLDYVSSYDNILRYNYPFLFICWFSHNSVKSAGLEIMV